MDRLADLAWRRPWALLAGNLAVLAVLMVVAVGAPAHLGVGSLALDGAGSGAGGGEADLVIATTGDVPVRAPVYQVALRVISAQVRSDPAVATLRQGPISADRRSTTLLVTLRSGDPGKAQQAVERIESQIDPGPLHVVYGGQVGTWLDARHDLSGDLWRLELLAVPLALLALGGALGVRLGLAPIICAATAVAGALAGLRIAGGFAELSLLGIAPAAVVGLVLGVEAPCLLVARFRNEAGLASPLDAMRGVLATGGAAALPLGVATTAATVGLVTTGLDQAASMVLACALAAFGAIGSALVTVPALVALPGLRAGAGSGVSDDSQLARPARALTGFLARSRLRTFAAAVLAVAVLLAASSPVLHGDSRPFSAADLPAGSQARLAATIAAGGSGAAAEAGAASPTDAPSLFEKLALAVTVSVAALALVLVVVFRTLRVLPVAIAAFLPATAACGLAVLVFQDGHLAGALGFERQGTLETGAVASLGAALAAVCAFRAVVVTHAAREERALGLTPGRTAATTAAFTMPAAAVATVVGAAAAGVLAGADLYSAREFGLAVAAGLLAELFVLRAPLVSALARWGG